MPCLLQVPEFLSTTGYTNPTNVLRSAFQIAHKTDKPAYEWVMEQPQLMADFNLWMTDQRFGSQTWLDVFNVSHHFGYSSADTLLFVDIGGGLGQQCALLKKTHPNIPGRVVLQDQPFVLPNAVFVEGMEKYPHDFWTEQPLKGEIHPILYIVEAFLRLLGSKYTTCGMF